MSYVELRWIDEELAELKKKRKKMVDELVEEKARDVFCILNENINLYYAIIGRVEEIYRNGEKLK